MERPKKPLTIAIDGPVGAGKSTVAKLLAQRLGYLYVDSGAMYRALAWKALDSGLDLRDTHALADLAHEIRIEIIYQGGDLKVSVDGRDVSQEIRGARVGRASSLVSTFPEVRQRMVELQRKMGSGRGVVIEGRDIGTVVFPDAAVKFYLYASLEERGQRRHRELERRGEDGTLEETLEEIKRRNAQDMGRIHSPLKRAPDAIFIDSTGLSPEEVVEAMMEEIRRLI
ncbi:MAG: (d)CMP kinase [candidate division NC10 bacterium]|nr:(d)CMP kinase [candidate division NC10 bacterium]